MRILVGFLCCTACARAGLFVRNAAVTAANSDISPGSLIEVGMSPPPGGSFVSVDPSTVVLKITPSGSQTPMSLPVLGAKSPFSVLAFLPKDISLGPAELHFLISSAEQGSTTAIIVSTSFGLFTNNGLIAIAQNVRADGGVEPNSLTRPARPGSYVTLWGTGLGMATEAQVSVAIGGRLAAVTYAGAAPGLTGVDQINIRIPDDPVIPEGCYVAVDVTAAGRPGNRGSISFSRSDAPACRHPLGLTVEQMQILDGGGSISTASLLVSGVIGPPPQTIDWTKFTRNESADVILLALNGASIALQSGVLVADDALFRCSSFSTAGGVLGFISAGGAVSAGDRMMLTGPDGRVLDMPGQPDFSPTLYRGSIDPPPAVESPDAVPDSFFTPGAWTLAAPGGKEVPPFSVSLALTAAIRITNTEELRSIDRNLDMTVKWNQQGFSDGEIVAVTLGGAPLAIMCYAPALAGSVTIPSELLARLSPRPASVTPPPFVQISAFPRPNRVTTFQIPRTNGMAIPGAFRRSSSEVFSVEIR